MERIPAARNRSIPVPKRLNWCRIASCMAATALLARMKKSRVDHSLCISIVNSGCRDVAAFVCFP